MRTTPALRQDSRSGEIPQREVIGTVARRHTHAMRITLFAGGIIAAIAIPAYQDHRIQTAVQG
ncbi:MAG TPA: hypothetical protein VES73_11805 [Lamprocystis sp. (in: g-proteobacteria)]|nr:hypothetical protein [Lamprocystis sp. (in: g-proteobacteria)]